LCRAHNLHETFDREGSWPSKQKPDSQTTSQIALYLSKTDGVQSTGCFTGEATIKRNKLCQM
jgi:hypothetical protein